MESLEYLVEKGIFGKHHLGLLQTALDKGLLKADQPTRLEIVEYDLWVNEFWEIDNYEPSVVIVSDIMERAGSIKINLLKMPEEPKPSKLPPGPETPKKPPHYGSIFFPSVNKEHDEAIRKYREQIEARNKNYNEAMDTFGKQLQKIREEINSKNKEKWQEFQIELCKLGEELTERHTEITNAFQDLVTRHFLVENKQSGGYNIHTQLLDSVASYFLKHNGDNR